MYTALRTVVGALAPMKAELYLKVINLFEAIDYVDHELHMEELDADDVTVSEMVQRMDYFLKQHLEIVLNMSGIWLVEDSLFTVQDFYQAASALQQLGNGENQDLIATVDSELSGVEAFNQLLSQVTEIPLYKLRNDIRHIDTSTLNAILIQTNNALEEDLTDMSVETETAIARLRSYVALYPDLEVVNLLKHRSTLPYDFLTLAKVAGPVIPDVSKETYVRNWVMLLLGSFYDAPAMFDEGVTIIKRFSSEDTFMSNLTALTSELERVIGAPVKGLPA